MAGKLKVWNLATNRWEYVGGQNFQTVDVGEELAYAELTSVVQPTVTTEATAVVLVTAGSVKVPPTGKLWVEFFSPGLRPALTPAGANMTIVLYEDGVSIGRLGMIYTPAAGDHTTPVLLRRRLLRTEGDEHIYSVRAYVSVATGYINAGPGGGTGSIPPAYIRVYGDLAGAPIQTNMLDSGEWIAPTLTNAWVNYGGSFNEAGYRRDPMGYVHLKGLIKSGTIGSPAFTLPVGYRPSGSELVCVISNNAIGRVDIGAAGTVTPAVPSVNGWVSLDGVTFKAEL